MRDDDNTKNPAVYKVCLLTSFDNPYLAFLTVTSFYATEWGTTPCASLLIAF